MAQLTVILCETEVSTAIAFTIAREAVTHRQNSMHNSERYSSIARRVLL